MEFQVGDKVVHRAHGIGEVVQLDEKVLAGQTLTYYVIRIRDMTIWVPANGEGEQSLRLPTPASEFENLFKILGGPAEPLSEDRMERKLFLSEQLKLGTLDTICRVIRDVKFFGRSKKLNDYDLSILERAQNFLLEEWMLSSSIPLAEAQRELKRFFSDGSN